MLAKLIGLIRIAIVDDLKSDLQKSDAFLRNILKQPQFEKIEHEITHYNSGEAFLKSKKEYDLLFLDVQMSPGMDGFEVGRNLKKRLRKPLYIYLTTHDSRAPEAFPIGGFGYLSKNFDEEKVIEILDLAIKEIHSNQIVIVKHRNKQADSIKEKTIYLDDITHIESLGKDSFVFTKNEAIHSIKSLKYWEDVLPKDRFYRIHKSYLINFMNTIDISKPEKMAYLDCEISKANKVEVAKEKVADAHIALHHFWRRRGNK